MHKSSWPSPPVSTSPFISSQRGQQPSAAVPPPLATGANRIHHAWIRDNEDGRAIEALLEARLADAAASDDPSLIAKTRNAAQALLNAFDDLNMPSDVSHRLMTSDSLWTALLQAQGPGAPDREGAMERRQLFAHLVVALLTQGEQAMALQLLNHCPHDADRRVVLKHLLQWPDPSGCPLALVNKPVVISAIDTLLGQTLDWKNHRGRYPYRRLKDRVDALRVLWHPPQDTRTVRHQLVEHGWRITMDNTSGERRLRPLSRSSTLNPRALDLLVSYCQLQARHALRGPAAFGVLWDALRQWGVDLGDGSTLEPGNGGVKAVQAQLDALDSTAREALADFVRRACAALFATGHEPGLLGLIRLSLLLEDNHLSTHAEFCQGAAAAVKRHGLAGLWILSQSPTPKNTLDIVLSLKEWLPGIESPRAALRCIQDVMAFLARLHGHRTRSGEAWQDTWPVARSHLLPGMLNAFTRLIERGAQTDDPDWVRLAQWVWVTGATLNLLSPGLFDKPAVESLGVLQANGQRLDSTALELAPCLNLLDRLDGLFHHTLMQLCSPAVLELPEPMLRDKEVQIKSLFLECPTDIRHAVLRLPLAAIWPFLPPSLTIKGFLEDLQALPDQAIDLLLQLKERDDIPPNKWEWAMIHWLHEPAFVRVTNARPADVTMAQWVIGTLNLLRDRLLVKRQPAGLPHLLGCFRRVTQAATAPQRQAYWINWADFTIRFIQANQGERNACFLIGTYLPLGPSPLAASEQIRAIAQALGQPAAMTYLLMAWLRQNFEQATLPAADDKAASERAWLFLGVVHIASSYVKQLSIHEKRQFKVELDSMAQMGKQAIMRL